MNGWQSWYGWYNWPNYYTYNILHTLAHKPQISNYTQPSPFTAIHLSSCQSSFSFDFRSHQRKITINRKKIEKRSCWPWVTTLFLIGSWSVKGGAFPQQCLSPTYTHTHTHTHTLVAFRAFQWKLSHYATSVSHRRSLATAYHAQWRSVSRLVKYILSTLL